MKKAFGIIALLILLVPPAIYLVIPGVNTWVNKKVFAKWSREDNQTELKSFLTSINGVQKLQVAELTQFEKITRQSRRKVFWEKLELPVVVVSIEIPVTYTYYVDLKKKWSALEHMEGRWVVVVPDLENNPPAGEISAMNVVVEKASLFRNEESIKNQLMSEMSSYLRMRAEDHKEIVKEQARKELEKMITKWLDHRNSPSTSIEVMYFSEAELFNKTY